MLLWAHPSSYPKRHLDRFSRFSTAYCRESLYVLYNGPPFPLKIASLHGHLDPHIICGSSGSPESTTQTARRSVQPFFAGLKIVTDTLAYRRGWRGAYFTFAAVSGCLTGAKLAILDCLVSCSRFWWRGVVVWTFVRIQVRVERRLYQQAAALWRRSSLRRWLWRARLQLHR